MKNNLGEGQPQIEPGDRLGWVLLGCVAALPLLPEYMAGYALILWLGWRIYRRNLGNILPALPVSAWLVLPYFLWYLGRWWATGWHPDGGRILLMHAQWILFPLLLAGLPPFMSGAPRWSLFFLWSVVVLVAVALTVEGIAEWMARVTPIEGYSDHPLFYIGLSAPLMHPGYLSMLVFVAMLTTAVLIRPSWLRPWLFYSGQCLLLVFVVMLSSRMILGAMMATLPLVAAGRVRRLRPRAIIAAGAMMLLLTFLAVRFLPEPMRGRLTELSRFEYRMDADSLSDFSGVTIRLAEWRGALHAWAQSPSLGHGPGRGKVVLMDSYDQLGFSVGRRYHFNAHNQFMETALDLGWVGVLLVLLSILAVAWPHLNSQNTLLWWFLVFFLLCSTTESTLLRQRGVAMLAIYIPLLGALRRGDYA